MPENRRGEGRLVVLENCTAASNIVGGTMIAVGSGANQALSFSSETTGLTSTGGGMGVRFVGILDDDVSAGQCPIAVWTDGIFELQLASSITTAALIGRPVYACISGGGLLVQTLGAVTGTIPVGTVVGLAAGTSGQYVRVKITPGAYNWGIFGRVDAIATSNAVLDFGNIFPPVL